jgi:hypothetical protein
MSAEPAHSHQLKISYSTYLPNHPIDRPAPTAWPQPGKSNLQRGLVQVPSYCTSVVVPASGTLACPHTWLSRETSRLCFFPFLLLEGEGSTSCPALSSAEGYCSGTGERRTRPALGFSTCHVMSCMMSISESEVEVEVETVPCLPRGIVAWGSSLVNER